MVQLTAELDGDSQKERRQPAYMCWPQRPQQGSEKRTLSTAHCRRDYYKNGRCSVYFPRYFFLGTYLGTRYFSTLDARSGYWQIPLDEDSSKLTTFNTPFGRFRYIRMPFGIRSAQEVIHKRIHQIFEDLEGVETDIEISWYGDWRKTRQEHDDRLRATLHRAR